MSFRDKVFDKITVRTGRKKHRLDQGVEEFTIRIRQLRDDCFGSASRAIQDNQHPSEHFAKYEYYCILNVGSKPVEIKGETPDSVKYQILKILANPNIENWENFIQVCFSWPMTYEEKMESYQVKLENGLKYQNGRTSEEDYQEPVDYFDTIEYQRPVFHYKEVCKATFDDDTYWGTSSGFCEPPVIGLKKGYLSKWGPKNHKAGAIISDTPVNRDFLKRLETETSEMIKGMGKIAVAGEEYWNRMVELVNTGDWTIGQACRDVLPTLPDPQETLKED